MMPPPLHTDIRRRIPEAATQWAWCFHSLTVADRRTRRGIQHVLSHGAGESNTACRYSECTRSTTLQYLAAVLRLRLTVPSRLAATWTMPSGRMPTHSNPPWALPTSSKQLGPWALGIAVRGKYPLGAPIPPWIDPSYSPVSYTVSSFSTHRSARLSRLPGPGCA